MSSGPPARKPKPRSVSASWSLERPRSNSAPSTVLEARLAGDRREFAEVGLAQDQAIPETGAEATVHSGDGRPIGVETEEAAIRVGRLQDPLGVPTAAEGGVDLEATRGRREHRHDLVCQHRDVRCLHLSSTYRRSDPERTLEAHVMRARCQALRRPGPAPAGRRGPGRRSPTWPGARSPRDRASPRRPPRWSRPMWSRRYAGSRTRPCRSSSTSAALANTNRWKRREASLVMGSAATFAASSSQPAWVWMARHASSHRETTAPAPSWTRNFAGTAIRPLSSTVCRYSPVNTRTGSLDCGAWSCGSGFECLRVPHFPPLWTTSLHSSALKPPRQSTKSRSGSALGAVPRPQRGRHGGRPGPATCAVALGRASMAGSSPADACGWSRRRSRTERLESGPSVDSPCRTCQDGAEASAIAVSPCRSGRAARSEVGPGRGPSASAAGGAGPGRDGGRCGRTGCGRRCCPARRRSSSRC